MDHEPEREAPMIDDLAQRMRWKVHGMDCPSCVNKIEGAVSKFAGVSDARLSFSNEILEFDLDASLTNRRQVEQKIRALDPVRATVDSRTFVTPEASFPAAHRVRCAASRSRDVAVR